jgi:hypothetical protein
VLEYLVFACSLLALGALLVPNTGEARMLENIVNKTAPVDPTLHLYSNDVTPADGDTAASYTEIAGGGYASKSLAGATWTIVEGAPSVASFPEQIFAFTGVPGVATVYGYFIKQGTRLMWAERLPAPPFTVTGAGDEVKVTPRFELSRV